MFEANEMPGIKNQISDLYQDIWEGDSQSHGIRKAIEFMGDFWHANPKIYKDNFDRILYNGQPISDI